MGCERHVQIKKRRRDDWLFVLEILGLEFTGTPKTTLVHILYNCNSYVDSACGVVIVGFDVSAVPSDVEDASQGKVQIN